MSLSSIFSKRFFLFALMQVGVIFGIIWVIAGNDFLFRNTVPIEQRLVSRNDPIRKKAQQELLGFDLEKKREVASRLIPALQQEDPFIIKWAAISLALIGPSAQQAIPFLLQSVSAREKDAAQAARVALSEIGAPDAKQLPSLLRALQDPRDSVRCESALSVGKMGPDASEAMPVLIGYLGRQESTPVCFEEALAALAAGVPDVYPTTIELLSSGHVELRRKAANVLAMAGVKTPETIRAVMLAMETEKDARTRSRLARALRLVYIPDEKPDSVLNAALRADSVDVRLVAAQILRRSVTPGSRNLSSILKMIRDPDVEIRKLGLEALRRSGQMSPDILQKVAHAQKDEAPGVRCRAAETLIESGATDRVSISLLIGDLRGNEDSARCAENVLAMAGLFSDDVMYSMMHLVAEDKDIDVRSRAARVLMHLGPRASPAIPVLQRARQDKVPGTEMALRAIRSSPNRKHR